MLRAALIDLINIDTVTAQTYATANPAAVSEQQFITQVVTGKQMVMTTTALAEFAVQVMFSAGPLEKVKAANFLNQVQMIADQPSARVMALTLTRRGIKHNDKLIFGTGDKLNIITITADQKFPAAAYAQGVNLYPALLFHQPYSFTGI